MRIISPREELRRYVRYYWVLKADEPFNVLTFPIGCPQMIFHRKTPLYIPELGSRQPRFAISGQVNFPAHISSDGDTEMIVAVFCPHTIGMFVGVPPSAFYNKEISGYDIDDARLGEVAAKVFDSQGAARAVSGLERWLLTKINPTMNLRRIEGAIATLMRRPSVSVNELAAEACLCKRQFERQFREHIGMNPKEYGRIVRFQKALRMMQLGLQDYAGVAYSVGYADQSHFIRDFRRFSGFTPKRLLQYQAPYSDLYSNPV